VADTSQSLIIDTAALEIGSSVGRKACGSIATINLRDNFALSRFLIAGNSNAQAHADERSSSVGRKTSLLSLAPVSRQ
jgi:hypothetical protein